MDLARLEAVADQGSACSTSSPPATQRQCSASADWLDTSTAKKPAPNTISGGAR
ncbi:hypothetical protein [Oleiharenicola sp. Vm1]|uniref:hypothetical protein n=1 Tax=Oleiharenicola sp. Vm1 TaxID=3398393 RepID=UPI0039F57229